MENQHRKKLLKLDEGQWEQVRAFNQESFLKQPGRASNATYASLIKEIQGPYPCIILSKSSFKTYVGLIETLRSKAGIQGKVDIARKYFEKISEIFHEILIGLPLDEFNSIHLERPIQRANKLYPGLQIIDKKRQTLAEHFPIKRLKAHALQKRPANDFFQTMTRSRHYDDREYREEDYFRRMSDDDSNPDNLLSFRTGNSKTTFYWCHSGGSCAKMEMFSLHERWLHPHDHNRGRDSPRPGGDRSDAV
jgi:hypothetical protein